MRGKKSKRRIIISITIIIIITQWLIGITNLWLDGMRNIAYNKKAFTDKKGYLMAGEYSVSINLSDLQSNLGKELYNDGSNKIYVSWISNRIENSGIYAIGFRSSGQYSLTKATLVSGARHATINDNSFSTYMTAKMKAKYNGKIYDSYVYGTSGLNYRDGDEFLFYMFPPEAYDEGEISLSKNGIVELSITNLYKNIWTKK